MTEKDLRLKYKGEETNNPFNDYLNFYNEYTDADLISYIKWLEDLLIASKEVVLELQSEIVVLKNMDKL